MHSHHFGTDQINTIFYAKETFFDMDPQFLIAIEKKMKKKIRIFRIKQNK